MLVVVEVQLMVVHLAGAVPVAEAQEETKVYREHQAQQTEVVVVEEVHQVVDQEFNQPVQAVQAL
jgi:hypothetical protein